MTIEKIDSYLQQTSPLEANKIASSSYNNKTSFHLFSKVINNDSTDYIPVKIISLEGNKKEFLYAKKSDLILRLGMNEEQVNEIISTIKEGKQEKKISEISSEILKSLKEKLTEAIKNEKSGE